MEVIAPLFLGPFAIAFAVATIIFARQRRLHGAAWIAPIGLIGSVAVMVLAIAIFRGMFVKPSEIFQAEFGFAPPADVRNLQGEYRHILFVDHSKLSFTASSDTIRRVASDRRWAMTDAIACDNDELDCQGMQRHETNAWLQPPDPNAGCCAVLCSDTADGHAVFFAQCGY